MDRFAPAPDFVSFHLNNTQAAEAMRLVAIAQQLVRREASAQPAALQRPRRQAARRAAPILEQSDDPSDEEEGGVADEDDADFSDLQPLSRNTSPRRSARGLQVPPALKLLKLMYLSFPQKFEAAMLR